MKWFWGTVWTSVLGAISALVVVSFQDQVKDALDGTEFSADVYTSPWQPYPVSRALEPADALRQASLPEYVTEELTKADEHSLVTIRLRNADIRDVEDVRVQTGLDSIVAGLLVRSGPNGERTLVEGDKTIKIDRISAGEDVFLFVWTTSVFDIRYNLEKFRAFTPDRPFTVRLHQYENARTELYDEPAWVSALDKWALPVLLIFMVIFMLILSLLAATWWAYLKKMLNDEDFYITEKLRSDAEGKKFQPDITGLKI